MTTWMENPRLPGQDIEVQTGAVAQYMASGWVPSQDQSPRPAAVVEPAFLPPPDEPALTEPDEPVVDPTAVTDLEQEPPAATMPKIRS